MSDPTASEDLAFKQVVITVVRMWRHLDGTHTRDRLEATITPDNIEAAAGRAMASHPDFLKDACVISRQQPPAATFRSREHFIPEGLGFGWTDLPLGHGTCDRINHSFGKYEQEWLRYGQMGVFRAFYVEAGKDKAPEYYAPKASNWAIATTRDAEGRFVLQVDERVKVELPDASGRGILEINVPRQQARVEWVSLALYKLALLSLWLVEGPLVFTSGFEALRAFLNCPTESTYRPFWQRVIEGSPPGVRIDFLEEGEEREEDGHRFFEVTGVRAALRCHHMQYGLRLVGDDEWLPDGQKWEGWVSPTEKVPDTTRIQIGFDSLRRRATTSDIEKAAYFRWLARGRRHGEDQYDWLGAEEELRIRFG